MPAIQTEGLRKTYRRGFRSRVEALKGVSLSVEPGQIFGLLGQNGAGKTTLIKILLGICRLSGGSAKLLDRPAGTTDVRRWVGYLPEDHRFPDYHTPETALHFYGLLYGMPRADRMRRIGELLEFVSLTEWRRTKVRKFSKGMKQRLGLAHAMLHNPKALFLDEPTDGVDPIGRKQIREALLRLREQGVTVFINSHLLSEVEMICDRVAILHLGNLNITGTVADLTRSENAYDIQVSGPVDGLLVRLQPLVQAIVVVPGGFQVAVAEEAALDRVVDAIRSQGVSLRGLTRRKRTLEDVFIDRVSAENAAPGSIPYAASAGPAPGGAA